MCAECVGIAEYAFQRVAIVDAGGAGHRVQRIDRFGGELRGISGVTFEFQFRFNIGDGIAPYDLHDLEGIVTQNEAR